MSKTGKAMIVTFVLSLVGAGVNMLPAPFSSDAVFAYGFAFSTFIAMRYGVHYALFSSVVVAAPPFSESFDPFIVLLMVQTLLIAYTCYRQSSSRLVSATLLFWLVVSLPVFGMQMVWFGQSVGMVEAGIFLTNFINALASSLIGHFAFIAVIILWPSDEQPPIKMGFLFRYFFTGLFFFATTAVTFVYIGFFQKEQSAELHAYLEQRSEVVAQQVDGFINGHAKAIQLVNDVLQDNPEQTDKRFAEIANLYPGFLTFLRTDDEGTITHAHPENLMRLVTESGELDVSYREYFLVPQRTGQSFVSSAFQGTGFGYDPIVAISSPYFQESGFGGVTEGSLDLSSFSSFDKREVHPLEALIITDQRGAVVFASDEFGAEILKPVDTILCMQASCDTTRPQKDWLISRVESAEYGWGITKLFPEKAFDARVSQYIVIAIALLILLTLLANVASVLVAIAFSKPLHALINNFNKFDPVNPSFDSIEFKSRQYLLEIAELDKGFDELRMRLVQLFGQLNLANSKQERFNAELTRLNSSLEQRVSEKTSSLEVALKQAKQASEAKSRFLANMSHEIRTPMNGILGACQNLRNANLDADSIRRLDVVQQSANTLMDILNGILDWSKIESGKMTLDTVVFGLPDQLRNCVELNRFAAEEKGIELSFNYAEDMPDFVKGDSTKLHQILNNLLSNAIKFTEIGAVNVDARYHRGNLILSVKDTGVGIEKEQVTNVFEEFAQADASTTRNFGGTGLGLAISQGLAVLMGGKLSLESEVGIGTTVSLRLPLRLANKPEKAKNAITKLPGKLKILMAEDNDINAEILNDMVKNAQPDIRMVRVADGEQALAAVQRTQFDVVLMDCQMPVMDGLDATRAIRKLPGDEANIPIIALTANAYSEDRQNCLDAGMNEHIAKPVNRETLFTVIDQCLSAGKFSS